MRRPPQEQEKQRSISTIPSPNFNQSHSLPKLNRPEQVILFRLRTGHNRLHAHMYSKFEVGESEMCPHKTDILTAEHLLHDALMHNMWPEPIPLYCNLEELRRTAIFVRATDISV